MKIREINIQNFGKITGKSYSFSDGINIVYGENESGKSTIHTFIKSMFFGLERGKGRAANNDTFTKYEPWENPNFYSGALKFESGGKLFCIYRNFDKYTRSVKLYCQDDGEELSIEKGDLDMLLDDMSESIFENTVSIGQLKAEPSQPLSVALKNYATNCYSSGGGDIDQSAALEFLRKRKKEIQREIDIELKKRQEEREHLELEASYVWRDIHKLQEEIEELEEEIEHRKSKEETEKEVPVRKWRIHPAVFLVFIILIALPFGLISRPWNYLVSIIIFLACGNYVWSRLKVGKKQIKTESERILEEISGESETLEKLIWGKEYAVTDLREKQIQHDNIKEQLQEMDILSETIYQMEQRKLAVTIAEQKIQMLSERMQEKLKDILNDKASKILSVITNGKYTHIYIEETLKMSVLAEEKIVNVDRLSRGTLEQIYFAIRMAATELLQKEEQPVILDDTFVYYDDARLKSTLEWLSENKEQVIIFTCQKREEEILKNMGIKYKTWHF